MTAFRTPSGGRVDRARPLRFRFDGRIFQGLHGDTLASALLANGVHLVGRSFKYHRPRGVVAAGIEEPNALVTVDRGGGRETPNLRATGVELYEGLVARSQNRFPSLAFDVGVVNDWLSPLFPAGFYYKTFKWPRSLWVKLYEPAIRATAGLGRAPRDPDPDRYLHRYAHCDVLVVGAGPAGLSAALAAADAGARVILCDEQAEPGGSLLHETAATIDGKSCSEWVRDVVADLAARGVRILRRTTAFGYYADNFIGLAERVTDHVAGPDARLPRERLWQVRAGQVVLAAGAIERPLVFPENDRPGITLADAARVYLNRYGVKLGARAVVVTADDAAYRTALELSADGIAIAAIADVRPVSAGAIVTEAVAAGINVKTGATVTGTIGGSRIEGVDLAAVSPAGVVGVSERIECDHLLVSGGWTPSVHLFSQSRGRLRYDDALQAFVPGEAAQAQHSIGACRGTYGLGECIAEGFAAGGAAAGRFAVRRTFAVVGAIEPCGGFIGALPHNREKPVKAFVDFQNDVTEKDLKLATAEGFRSIEHVKRYTTTGMATDQGKTSNMNALAIVAKLLDKPIPEVGLTTFRNPFTPVSFGTLAGAARGDMFDPVRTTPIHEWAVENGAVFEDVGLWKRARYFPKGGEDMRAAVTRECRAVREAAGMFDATTLGKIEVVGPDAAEFMNRMYINGWKKLEPGRCRYGVMLTEAGFVMDDGVVGRLAEDRFHVTTTTGGAPRVLHHMEDYLQTEFPDLKVWLTSTTEEWAVIAVQGRKARDVIAPLVEGVDISRKAMPHMSLRLGRIAGVPVRLFRVSFTGELGFEINVPAAKAREVWEAVYAAGRKFGIVPYGTETMHVLRAEKGYIIVGQETDGTQTPDDLGLGGMIGATKPDFVGKRSLTRPDMLKSDRKKLVGLLTVDPTFVLDEGAQVVADQTRRIPAKMIGHVTSSYWSATLNRSIALGLVAGGPPAGSTLYVPMPDRMIEVRIADPVLYDRSGERIDV